MKFGKKYTETLASAGFPPEWRQSAIEYRKLKKVINKVAQELQEVGLTSDVLKELLEKPEDGNAASTSTKRGELPPDVQRLAKDTPPNSSGDEEADPHPAAAVLNGKKRKRPRRSGHASYEVAGSSEHPEPVVRIVFDSMSSESDVSSSSAPSDSYFPFVSSDTGDDILQPSKDDSHRFTEINSTDEDDEDSSKRNTEDDETASTTSEGGQRVAPNTRPLINRMYGYSESSEDEHDHTIALQNLVIDHRHDQQLPNEQQPPKTPPLTPLPHPPATPKQERKPPVRSASQTDDGGDADDESVRNGGAAVVRQKQRRHHRQRRHRKEVVIPLNSDTEFLTMLAHALTSLAELQMTQKKQFTAAVELLAREVSAVSSPKRPRSDLYIWREIFALWVEASIFESDRERDRGERTVEEAEQKLNWFVDQVGKRKLAKRMRHKESRAALDKFIQLNTDLLDIKRFQMANEEAARKILKKHDKRTALTAAKGFPKFIAAAIQLSDPSLPPSLSKQSPPDQMLQRLSSSSFGGSSSRGRVLILPGFPSLPHVLLSTLTQTLLPIIPSIEDFECLICGDVAFKPIRLECGHKFCVRCLVKMQKRGQDACPQCRAPVVLRANATNLDEALLEYMKLWFPKEVQAKVKQNSAEVAKEELEAMGIHHKCVVS